MKFSSLRRFIIFSPQITVLCVVGVLLSITMIFLGAVIFQQVETNYVNLGFNTSAVNRPFSQLDRELLQMEVLVVSNDSTLTAAEIQTRRDVLASRWEVIFWQPLQDTFQPEFKDLTQQMRPFWEDISGLLDTWQANPDDRATQASLEQALNELEQLVFQTDVRYQSERNIASNESNKTSAGLLLALSLAALLVVGFIILSGFTIYHFFQQQREAEQETRAALAAKAVAIESSKFKDQFLAVMSHELRTPLNAIIGFLGIMNIAGKLDERNLHMVERSRANAERLLSLINDILDLGKIESGRLELVPMPVSPSELVQRWQYQMDVLAKQKGLKFSVTIDPQLPDKIMMDDGGVTKIATNLLSNAFKFTEKGEVTLDLRCQANQWIIEVRDTGKGIPAHMHETIFESFRQVDNSFTRAYGGTGLGLSIVQHLVKAMNGTIRVQSVMGEGSTFTVTLPLVLVGDQSLAEALPA